MENNELNREKHFKKKIFKSKLVKNIALTAVCLILGVVISFEYKNIMHTKEQKEIERSTASALLEEINVLRDKVEELNNTKTDLMEKIEVYESASNEEILKSLQDQNDLLKKFACLTDVVGEGIVITLTYDDPNDVAQSADNIRALLNELKASTAQAISINGERITAMSEVRAVNNYLVINGGYYYGPYTISVIGSAMSLESSMDMSIYPKFEQFFRTYGGSMTYKYENNIEIKAYDEELIEKRTDMLFDKK